MHVRTLARAALVLGLALQSCQSPRAAVPLVPAGATFRDLRQHTYSESSEENYSWPSLDPGEEHLAFVVSNEDFSRADVYTKPVNGRARTQKTIHVALDTFPCYSRDGERIAFSSLRTGNGDIYATNSTSGRAKRQIAASSDLELSPSWSADDSTIAFSRFSSVANEWEIWLFDLERGALTSLVPGMFPRFHPREDLILFQRKNPSTGLDELWTINTEGTEETQLLFSETASYGRPDWSPDGERIVFESSESVDEFSGDPSDRARTLTESLLGLQANDLWTMRSDGTELSQLTTHESADWGPRWGPSGRVYFASERDGFMNIWSVAPEFVENSAETAAVDEPLAQATAAGEGE